MSSRDGHGDGGHTRLAPRSSGPGGRTQRRFASLLAHEIRAPLAAMKSYAELLLRCPPEDAEERLSFLRAISEEASRLDRLLTDVTDLERIEQGFTAAPLECDLVALSQRAILSLKHRAEGKRIELHLRTEGEPRTQLGEPRLLLRALTALVENAIKFSPEATEVMVSVAFEAPATRIVVADQGIGVPAPAIPRIFEPFFQAATPPDPVTPHGSGLGLALVARIAERHAGTIDCEPRTPGSAFILTLPRNRGR